IRDFHVTGVQTCALPILDAGLLPARLAHLHLGGAAAAGDRGRRAVQETVVLAGRHAEAPSAWRRARFSWTSFSQDSTGRVVSISYSNRSVISGVTSATST